MTSRSIREGMEAVASFLREHPDQAIGEDLPATATVEGGLRCRADWPKGASMVSDMPEALGGGASAPTPGWLLRAALATCDATLIAMRAAALGIELSTLEVTVESSSDDRGLLGIGDAMAGPVEMRTRVRLAADGVDAQHLTEVVAWAEEHSPVGEALRRAMPMTTTVEILG